MEPIIFIVSYALLFLVITAKLSGALKLALSFAILYSSAEAFKKINGWRHEFGIIMLKSKKGVCLIKSIANRYAWLLHILGDIGIAFAFGISSLLIMRWRSIKERLLYCFIGLILIGVVIFIYPLSLLYFKHNISGNEQSNVNIALIITSLFGMLGSVSYSIIITAIDVIKALVSVLLNNATPPSAKASFIIPGVNIPLIEGIIALIVILIIHEGGHALTSQLAKMRIHGTGVVLLGSLPIGAFVDLDENDLEKASVKYKLKTIIAGPFFNILAGIVFSLLLIAFLYLTKGYASEGCFVAKAGHSIFLEKAKCINLNSVYIKVGKDTLLRYYKNIGLMFLYNVLNLLTSLNILIGLVNLLPVLFFDGYHALRALIKNNLVFYCIIGIISLSLIILFIPSLF